MDRVANATALKQEDSSSRGTIQVDSDVSEGSLVIVRLRDVSPARYSYAWVEAWDAATGSLRLRSCSAGQGHLSELDVSWAVAARDTGWLQPVEASWMQAERRVFFRLLQSDEWVAAWVAEPGGAKSEEGLALPLRGVEGLPSVTVEQEVGMLFVPHESCEEEFSGSKPGRNMTLVELLSQAFICQGGRSETRRRWVLQGRAEIQFPMRCVWIHPQIKEGALGEFVRRCQARREERRTKCASEIPPELVMVLGPPGSGKSSSVAGLPSDEVPAAIKETVASMPFREEVNNDNLTDCMPGFASEFSNAVFWSEENKPPDLERAKSILSQWLDNQKSLQSSASGCVSDVESDDGSLSWALQWLVYLMFHHGPVRDSIAWDVIKVTIVDAIELPVYYSSVMAGAAISRAMKLLEYAHDKLAPVPHMKLRTVLLWPWASQEQRLLRQKSRHLSELENGCLQGGNFDANLVDLHYHAEQAEHNILKMLYYMGGTEDIKAGSKLKANGIKAIDYLLIVDNNASSPRVLLSCAVEAHSSKPTISFGQEWNTTFACDIRETVDEMEKLCESFPLETSGSFRQRLRAIISFFKDGDPLLQWPGRVARVLDLLMELDEAAFNRTRPGTACVQSQPSRLTETLRTPIGPKLETLDDDSARRIKPVISELRKFCLAAAVQRMSATLPALPATPSSTAPSQPQTPQTPSQPYSPQSHPYSPQLPPPPRSASRPTTRLLEDNDV